ncbi:hypothetical protein COOONC_18779 [Cooperia oncophora]
MSLFQHVYSNQYSNLPLTGLDFNFVQFKSVERIRNYVCDIERRFSFQTDSFENFLPWEFTRCGNSVSNGEAATASIGIIRSTFKTTASATEKPQLPQSASSDNLQNKCKLNLYSFLVYSHPRKEKMAKIAALDLHRRTKHREIC